MGNPTQQQFAALVRMWKLAQHDYGGARVACRLLLGCYNGTRFPFDLTDLRLLDNDNLVDALTVLAMDARPYKEVHELLNDALGRRDIGPRMELLAYNWRLKGAVKKAEVSYLQERIRMLAEPRGLAAVRQAQMQGQATEQPGAAA